MTRGGSLREYFAGLPGRVPWRWFRPPVRSRIFDWFIAIFTTVVTVLQVLFTTPRPSAVTGLWISGMVTVACLALVWRRTHPAQVLALAAITDIIAHAAHRPADLMSLECLFALYACGRYLAGRTTWLVAGPAIALEFASSFFWSSDNAIPDVIIAGLTVALGQYRRLRREMVERARREAASVAVRNERRRIARELHDVVAHHISVMSVLVGAARTTMTIDPVKASEALTTTEKTAREALAEMRQLLAVLRADDTDELDALGARAAQVPALVEAVRKAGVAVELEIDGSMRELPAAVDLAVFRIVQESLTNARKHAPGAEVSVALRYAPAEVEVAIVNDDGGAGKPVPAGPASGYGLGGMAERVALCHGRLQAGALPGGGFAVRAWIPAAPAPTPPLPSGLDTGFAETDPNR